MKYLTEIQGHSSQVEQLVGRIQREEVAHLLLFSGPEGIGKKKCALAFAHAWLESISDEPISNPNSHPDIHVAKPKGKSAMHSIESIRSMMATLSLAPYQAKGKVVIIDDAERMLPASSNALLKTLEEPPKNSLIILVTSKPDLLLETIHSRAQEVRFQGIPGQEADETFPFEPRLFDLLALPVAPPFSDIVDCAKEIGTYFDDKKKSFLKEALSSSKKEELTPFQKQEKENEVEGAIALVIKRDLEKLLFSILAFCRDIELFSLLENERAKKVALLPQYEQKSFRAADSGVVYSLDQVAEALQSAKTAYDRSTPLSNIFETVLLRIFSR